MADPTYPSRTDVLRWLAETIEIEGSPRLFAEFPREGEDRVSARRRVARGGKVMDAQNPGLVRAVQELEARGFIKLARGRLGLGGVLSSVARLTESGRSCVYGFDGDVDAWFEAQRTIVNDHSIRIGNHSPVQWHSPGATMTVGVPDDPARAATTLRALLIVLPQLGLTDNDQVRSDVDTLITEVEKPNPDPSRTQRLWAAVKAPLARISEGTTQAVLSGLLADEIHHLLNLPV